jgi:hypothetical protein
VPTGRRWLTARQPAAGAGYEAGLLELGTPFMCVQ